MLAALRSCRLHLPAFGFAVGGGSCKDALCDITVQRASAATSWSGESAAMDWRRTQIFALFGACFVGGWQYILFTVGMQRLLPQPAAFARKTLTEKLRDREGLKVVAGLVAIENLVNQPFLHFPVYYAIKHSVEHTHDTLRACTRRRSACCRQLCPRQRRELRRLGAGDHRKRALRTAVGARAADVRDGRHLDVLHVLAAWSASVGR